MSAESLDPYRSDLTRTAWRKSSHSTAGQTCVEVAFLDGGAVALRDSKDTSRPALAFTPAEWAAFTAGVRDGEFDR
ncbi:DUF397 domain-containing protein [Streptomyces sp. NPDC054797]